jgi:WD40 repeat protein
LAVGGHGVVIHLFEAGTWEPAGRLIGHGANVRSLRFADDGRTLVSTCALGTVRLWDVEDERWRTQSRQGKLQGPAGVAFAADGARAAVAWSDGSVEVWDPRTRRIEEHFTCPTGVRHVDWSRGASRLAFASWEADVFVYDEDGLHAAGARSGPRRFSVTEPTEAHFDPSGALLAATAQDGNVRVWELASGNLLWREAVPFQGQAWPGVLFGAHWAPRQDELVVCGQGGRIQVRDGFTGRLLRETLRPGKLFAQFSPDGEKILAWAYAQNQGLELLDAATLALLWETGQTNHMWPLLAPDGARLFSANWQGLLGVWDAADGRLLTEIEALPPGNPRLAVSPDGECVILAVGGRVGFLDARHGR